MAFALALAGVTAHAQEQQEEVMDEVMDEAMDETMDEAAQGPSLDEIITYAGGSEELSHSTLVSLDIIRGDVIERGEMQDLGGLQNVSPSLTIGGDSPVRPYFFIRGVGSTRHDLGSDGGVAVFLDGVRLHRSGTLMTQLLDLEQAEVVKGPQSVMFGRGSTGGVINLVSRSPTRGVEGTLVAGRGGDGYNKYGAVASGRFTGPVNVRAGYLRRFETRGPVGTPMPGGKKYDEPSASTSVFGFDARPTRRLLVEMRLREAGLTQKGRISDAASTASGKYYGIRDSEAGKISDELAKASTLSLNNEMGSVDVAARMAMLRFNYQGRRVLTSWTSGRTTDQVKEMFDFDGTSKDGLRQDVDEESSAFSQELRFTGTSEKGSTWGLGTRFTSDDAVRNERLMAGADFADAAMDLDDKEIATFLDLHTNTLEAFAHGTAPISKRTGFSVGFRHSKDNRRYVYDLSGDEKMLEALGGDDPISSQGTLKTEVTNPTMTLFVKPSERVKLYATYGSATKSGGLQYNPVKSEDAPGAFEREEMISREMGLRWQTPNNRSNLSLSLYRYNYKDQQVAIPQTLTADSTMLSPFATIENAARSLVEGIEWKTMIAATDAMTLHFDYAYLSAKYDSFASEDGMISYNQNRMPYSPKYTYRLGADYRTTRESGRELTWRISYMRRSLHYLHASNSAISEQKAYGLLDFSLTFQPTKRSALRLFCSNCLDSEYRTAATLFPTSADGSIGGGARSSFGSGQKAGVEYQYRFTGRYNYGRNQNTRKRSR
ncbi:MAG: TonB-dependent receptor [Gammaproteobacteria bacterium AqS3]|nr:TonB-dependent receptor [Gammaproteobacteria bacterium AqS3]